MNIFIRSSSHGSQKTGKQTPGWKPLPQTLIILKKHIKVFPSKVLSLQA